jgi:hypothetical protein
MKEEDLKREQMLWLIVFYQGLFGGDDENLCFLERK